MKLKLFLLIGTSLFFLSQNLHATFSIETDLTSIDFGNMKPSQTKGDVPSQGVTVRCTTDQGNPWYLRMHLETPLTNVDNPSSFISDENFRWYGISTTGSGTLVMDEQDFSIERIAYTAPTGEGGSGVDVKLQFKLTVPSNIQSGPYFTRIILTLIE